MTKKINVIKRNGKKEALDLNKYHDMVGFFCENLSGCSVSEIELAASLQFVDGIKTSDIHKMTTKATADLISLKNPNYQYAAARSLLMEIRKEVWGQWKPKPLQETINKNVKNGFYEDFNKYYTKEEIAKWASKIKYVRDLNFTYAGLRTAIDKFLIKSKTKNIILETPQELNMLLSMAMFKTDPKRDERILDYYNDLSTFKISLPSPIMSGLRSTSKGYASCCLIDIGDTTESLTAANSAAVIMTAHKAGIGLGSGIRGSGASVKNGTVKHTGPVPILRWFEGAVKAFSQGSRGGCHFRDTEVEILEDAGTYKKIKIQDVKINDYIKSYNIETNKIEPNKVTELIKPSVKNPMKISTKGGYIINSEKHPILVKRNNKWLYVKSLDLELGDMLMTSEGNIELINKIETPRIEDNFYDLTVDKVNNFFAGFETLYCGHNSATIYHVFWDWDIEKILTLKSNKSTPENSVKKLDYGIGFNALFFERARKNENITLFSAEEVPLLIDNLYDYNLWVETYLAYEKKKGIRKKKLNARKLLKLFATERFETGRYYPLFLDNVNQGPLKASIKMSNLCLTGDTIVETNNGVKELKNVEIGELVKSYNTETKETEYKEILNFAMTSPKAKIIKITDESGKFIKCTEDHQIWTENRGYVMAKDLVETDILNIQ